MIAAALAAFAAATQSAPTVVQDNASDTFAADVRSATACLDRFYVSADSQLVARDLARRAYGEAGGGSGGELAAQLAACVALAPAGSSGRSALDIYAGLPLVRRGLAERLEAASIDVAGLDRLAASRDLRILQLAENRSQAAELLSAIRGLRVAEAEMERAVGYVVIARLDRLFGAIVRPPARPARHRFGTIGSADYPRQALQRDLQGRARIVFTITSGGRVEACEIIVSTGHPELDEPSCLLATQRFRYRPARDENGRPVAQIGLVSIRWQLPD